MVEMENRFSVPPRYWGIPLGLTGACLSSVLLLSISWAQGALSLVLVLEIVSFCFVGITSLSFLSFLDWDRRVPKRVRVGPNAIVGFLDWSINGVPKHAVWELPYSNIVWVSVRRHWLFSQIRSTSGTKVQDGRSQEWGGYMQVNHVIASEVKAQWEQWRARQSTSSLAEATMTWAPP